MNHFYPKYILGTIWDIFHHKSGLQSIYTQLNWFLATLVSRGSCRGQGFTEQLALRGSPWGPEVAPRPSGGAVWDLGGKWPNSGEQRVGTHRSRVRTSSSCSPGEEQTGSTGLGACSGQLPTPQAHLYLLTCGGRELCHSHGTPGT